MTYIRASSWAWEDSVIRLSWRSLENFDPGKVWAPEVGSENTQGIAISGYSYLRLRLYLGPGGPKLWLCMENKSQPAERHGERPGGTGWEVNQAAGFRTQGLEEGQGQAGSLFVSKAQTREVHGLGPGIWELSPGSGVCIPASSTRGPEASECDQTDIPCIL